MNELKNSDLFIKLHLTESRDEVLLKAKTIVSIEDNSTRGTIVTVLNGRCFLVEEKPNEVIALMDKATHNASSILAGQIMDVLGIGGKKPDDPRQARKVID